MPQTLVLELVGNVQLDALIFQKAVVQVLEAALWRDQGRAC